MDQRADYQANPVPLCRLPVDGVVPCQGAEQGGSRLPCGAGRTWGTYRIFRALQGTEERLHDCAGLVVVLRHEVRVGLSSYDLFRVAQQCSYFGDVAIQADSQADAAVCLFMTWQPFSRGPRSGTPAAFRVLIHHQSTGQRARGPGTAPGRGTSGRAAAAGPAGQPMRAARRRRAAKAAQRRECQAWASTGGRRCRDSAQPGSIFCAYHAIPDRPASPTSLGDC